MPLLNQEQIKEIIPHRDPFLLIDEIIELEPGKRVVGLNTFLMRIIGLKVTFRVCLFSPVY